MRKLITAIVGGLSLAVTAAAAHEYWLGTLEIIHPYAHATAPDAPEAAGYMTIRNTGSTAERLVGASTDFAAGVRIREVRTDAGAMSARNLDRGLDIPAGGEVVLKPDGFQITFTQLKEQLREGDRRSATLKFRDAGEIEVDLSVEDAGAVHH